MVSVLRRRQDDRRTVPPDFQEDSMVPLGGVEIPPTDPLHALLVSEARPVATADLDLQSPVLQKLTEDGVEIIVPLVGQGELLGAMYLGPRLSDQPYSSEDRRLLGNLAAQVAPAMRVAQMVREQQAEAKERERIHQELQVAALIQQTLLPRQLPSRSGWSVDAFYRPARSVGGDFYDFIDLKDGRLGVAIGDVTDKGVPAALVMATCRSMLRAAAMQAARPGEVLQDVNNQLVEDIPPAMFVTCLYTIINTNTGEIVLANAGHNLPYVRTREGVIEIRATGMPLGLMPDMVYEERSFRFAVGDVMVLSSDGITEAHNPSGEMYGFSRLLGRLAAPINEGDVLGALVEDVQRHTGELSEQEDDVTLVAIKRTASAAEAAEAFLEPETLLERFAVTSQEGNERYAIDKIATVARSLALSDASLERLKTAVGEAVMNAMEHGNRYQPDLEVEVEVRALGKRVTVRVTDRGGDTPIVQATEPDLAAKLAGEQTPRGWGLYLIRQMVDEVNTWTAGGKHTMELTIDEGGR